MTRGDRTGHDSVRHDNVGCSSVRHGSVRRGGAGRTRVGWLIVERCGDGRRIKGEGLYVVTELFAKSKAAA